jgi:hypothetical protein
MQSAPVESSRCQTHRDGDRSVCYAEMRNIVCLCSHHHGHWKQRNSSLYWEIIREHIGPELWELHKRWRDNQKAYPMSAWDWEKAEIALLADLTALRTESGFLAASTRS